MVLFFGNSCSALFSTYISIFITVGDLLKPYLAHIHRPQNKILTIPLQFLLLKILSDDVI